MEDAGGSEEQVDYSSDPMEALRVFSSLAQIFVSSCSFAPESLASVDLCSGFSGMEPMPGAFSISMSGGHENMMGFLMPYFSRGVCHHLPDGGSTSSILGSTICSRFGSWDPSGCQVGYGLDPVLGLLEGIGSMPLVSEESSGHFLLLDSQNQAYNVLKVSHPESFSPSITVAEVGIEGSLETLGPITMVSSYG